MSGYELELLARARRLTDVDSIRDEVLAILGAARRAGLDPDATRGLVGAALTLGAPGHLTYAAGTGPGRTYRDETAFIAAIADTEDLIYERLAAALKLHDLVMAALDAALDDLADAKEGSEAEADALARIMICEQALDILDPLIDRLKYTLARIRAVPSDLGETYESVYRLLRRGGRMPHRGRWITGETPAGTILQGHTR